MVCLGLKPGATRWKVQTIPLSYGGTPRFSYVRLGKPRVGQRWWWTI